MAVEKLSTLFGINNDSHFSLRKKNYKPSDDATVVAAAASG